MARVVRYEFVGNWFLFWLFCITGVGIPIGVLYLLHGTLRIEEDVDDAERLLQTLRGGSPKS